MLTSFFSTTKNPQRLALLVLLLTPFFFIEQPIIVGIWSLMGFSLTALLLEFLSLRFGALTRTNGLYWLIAGACFYGGSWAQYDFQVWLETALMASYIGGLLHLSANGSRRDPIFVTAFLGMAVVYVIPHGWMLLLLTPLAMLQWQERDLRKWWLMLLGMGAFTFLFWTVSEIFPWHSSAWAPVPRPLDDWYFTLSILGIGLVVLGLRFGLWPNKWVPAENRRVRTMLWALLLVGVSSLVLDINTPYMWVCTAYLFWVWMPVVIQQIPKKVWADLMLILLLATLLLTPQLL